MRLSAYLPSGHFASTALSLCAAGALILAAHYATRPAAPATLSASAPSEEQDWQAALTQIQAEAPGLPAAPSEDTVQALLAEAESSNVTTSVARSLLINLSDAGAQGLGSDLPTQEKLIADATVRIGSIKGVRYSAADLESVAQNKDSLREWGNAVMRVFKDHPRANNDEALFAVGYALDGNVSSLGSLTGIAAAYAALAEDLAEVGVPSTIAPLYLQLIQNLSTMSAAAAEMQRVVDDPLRGLAGLQAFQSSGSEAARVLTALAEQLRAGGILFTNDEAGNAWSAFLP